MKIVRSAKLLSAVFSAVLSVAGCNSDRAGGGSTGSQKSLTVTIAQVGSGVGSITTNIAGFGCSVSCKSQSVKVASGTTITFKASASATSAFQGWDVSSCPGVLPCTLTINSDFKITASFEALPAGSPGEVIALTTTNRLISFNRATPETLRFDRAITGLQDGENLVGVDIRPASGSLFAVSSQNRLYTINVSTGAATLVATLTADPSDSTPFTTLSGTAFGVDFNPQADRLRVVSNTGQNLRIRVADDSATASVNEAGLTFSDTALPSTDKVTAVAYTNNFPSAAGTVLFGINTKGGTEPAQLVIQNPPNDGTLTAVSTLTELGAPLTIAEANGFDVTRFSTNKIENALAVFTVSGAQRLYMIDLGTGETSLLGSVGTADPIRGIALAPAASGLSQGDTFVLLEGNQLASLNRSAPSTVLNRFPITGLAAGDQVIGIDFRPKDQKLYAVAKNGVAGRIYLIDTITGLSSATVSLINDQDDNTADYSGLSGLSFGVDFDPVADTRPDTGPSLRIVSSSGQNYIVDADTGETGLIADGLNRCNMARAELDPANATGLAFSNSFDGTRATTAYLLDTTTDTLATFGIDIFNLQCLAISDDSTIVDTGSLGVDADGTGGFEVDAVNNKAFAILRTGSGLGFYQINLGTGAATEIGDLDGTSGLSGSETVQGLALQQPLAASAFGLAVTADGASHLYKFGPNDTSTFTDVVVTVAGGALLSETLIGIDFRMQDCSLSSCPVYAVGELLNVYRINPDTGVATQVSSLRPAPDDGSNAFITFDGTRFGMEFNPTRAISSEHLEIVSNAEDLIPGTTAGEYLQLDPATGFTRTNPTLAAATSEDGFTPTAGYPCDNSTSADGVAMAYTNNFKGAPSTTAFVISGADGCLKELNTATSKLFPIGSVNGNGQMGAINGFAGFDIVGGEDGLIVAALKRLEGTPGAPTAQSKLCKIALGRASNVQPTETRATECTDIGPAGTDVIRGIAIRLVPVANP
ncbi:MAG: DUF4394 domain-containing protein [Gammaproteobacteria bacterium]|nr:DUF4394 domain-containing protein [Gammaproteobacteria bacterium]